MYVLYVGGGVLFDHKKVNNDELKKMVKNKLLRKSKDRYYTNSDRLGELLMEIMLQEVTEFCKVDIQQNWAAHAHQQVMGEFHKSNCFNITIAPSNLSVILFVGMSVYSNHTYK